MTVTNAQVRKLMAEIEKRGEFGKAAMRAGMDRKTARKYRNLGKYPSEVGRARRWRTREDPFEADWPALKARLEDAPDLEAKTLFELLTELRPGRYVEGQLRTLQRRIKRWRAQEGPPKEVFFAQEHRPGEAAQTDFTWCNELGITLGGEPFSHMLCHTVLPYSNWEWAVVCRSESLLSIRRGVQAALFRLGHVPEYHQTDNSTAATHDKRGEGGEFVGWEEGTRKGRRFNKRYVDLMRHFEMKPRTTGIGQKEQNGDVEALNGALKRRLEQHLLLRGSRDFESVSAYENWVQQVMEKANRLRLKRLEEEVSVMRPLRAKRLPEFVEERVKVTLYSTIRIRFNTYSVPSRLKGEEVLVRLYDERLEIYHEGCFQFTAERLLGINRSRVDYRHVIDSLVKKPGAFPRYRHREAFFPSLAFREAHDALHESFSTWQADLEYLRVLQLAARELEAEVETALKKLLEAGEVPRFNKVEPLVVGFRPSTPEQELLEVDLSSYDRLLEGVA